MKTVEIVEPFTGYLEGRWRDFVAGETLSVPDDLPADYAQLIVDKNHARWGKPRAKQEKAS